MAELRQIKTAPGFVFDALCDGCGDAPLVLFLHGFAESFHMWRSQLSALAAAGYRAIAPSQRGYSPGARPDSVDPMNYHFDLLVADAMNIASACGYGSGRFHLVGHDWGGSIAWGIADRHPDRLACLTVLSRPPPNAFNRALAMPDGEQARRSRHHKAFLEPGAGPHLFANGARALRERLTRGRLPAAAIEQHLRVLGNEARWKRRSPGIAHAAPFAAPWAASRFPCFISGATRTTRWGGLPQRGPATSCAGLMSLQSCPASVISPPSTRPNASRSCCWRISPDTAREARREASWPRASPMTRCALQVQSWPNRLNKGDGTAEVSRLVPIRFGRSAAPPIAAVS